MLKSGCSTNKSMSPNNMRSPIIRTTSPTKQLSRTELDTDELNVVQDKNNTEINTDENIDSQNLEQRQIIQRNNDKTPSQLEKEEEDDDDEEEDDDEIDDDFCVSSCLSDTEADDIKDCLSSSLFVSLPLILFTTSHRLSLNILLCKGIVRHLPYIDIDVRRERQAALTCL